MRRTIPDLDQQILHTAEQVFLEQGLLNIEMKDLAQSLGISRSTLYRHFSSKLEIALNLILPYIVNLYDIMILLPDGSDGYAYVEAYLYRLFERFSASLEHVRFILEVDILYNSKTPMSSAIQKYEDFFRSYQPPLADYLRRGMEDGSIRNDMEPYKTAYILTNTCLSMTQRVGLREEVYRREHGFGTDVITGAIQLLLDGLRPEGKRSSR